MLSCRRIGIEVHRAQTGIQEKGGGSVGYLALPVVIADGIDIVRVDRRQSLRHPTVQLHPTGPVNAVVNHLPDLIVGYPVSSVALITD